MRAWIDHPCRLANAQVPSHPGPSGSRSRSLRTSAVCLRQRCGCWTSSATRTRSGRRRSPSTATPTGSARSSTSAAVSTQQRLGPHAVLLSALQPALIQSCSRSFNNAALSARWLTRLLLVSRARHHGQPAACGDGCADLAQELFNHRCWDHHGGYLDQVSTT